MAPSVIGQKAYSALIHQPSQNGLNPVGVMACTKQPSIHHALDPCYPSHSQLPGPPHEVVCQNLQMELF